MNMMMLLLETMSLLLLLMMMAVVMVMKGPWLSPPGGTGGHLCTAAAAALRRNSNRGDTGSRSTRGEGRKTKRQEETFIEGSVNTTNFQEPHGQILQSLTQRSPPGTVQEPGIGSVLGTREARTDLCRDLSQADVTRRRF
ncbi:unnamed protein product [Lampetra fluviatilis]